MSDTKIRLFPDPVLRKIASDVTEFNSALKNTIQTMIAFMRSQPDGIGLAAPQIGISKKIAIVDVSVRNPDAGLIVLINPVILESTDEILSREGCMSIPEYTAYLKRYQKVLVRWQDENGDSHQRWSHGIEAICIQHEIDHLNGHLFIDRVVSLKTDMIPRKSKKK